MGVPIPRQADRVTFQRLTAWFGNNRNAASEKGIAHEWLLLSRTIITTILRFSFLSFSIHFPY